MSGVFDGPSFGDYWPADEAPEAGAAEVEALAGEVWQESDGVLLLCITPGKKWRDFNGDDVPWNASLIARPLARLLFADGRRDTDALVAQARAEGWDRGYSSGYSNAARRMSDEPAAPTTPNPYRTGGAR